MLKKESQHSVLCTTTCIPHPVCDLWKQSWRTDHGERRHSSLQSELASDWGKTDCSPRARGTVLRNKNFALLWQWVNFTIPAFHGAQFTMNLVEMFNRWIQCIKKQKKETEAGDLLPYSSETSIPHSNAIKIIPQLKKPDASHVFSRKTKPSSSIHLMTDPIASRFPEDSPPLAVWWAVVCTELVWGCQPCSRLGTNLFYSSEMQCWFNLRRVTENNLFSPFFRAPLFPLASAHSLPTLGARADFARSVTSSHLG